METLLDTFGYLAVLIGVAIEGEVVVLTAGYLSHRGILEPVGVGTAAFAGSLLVYHTSFWLGRHRGQAILARRPEWQARVDGLRVRLRRNDWLLIVSYRLLFGLRAATPFALGLSGVPHRRFLLIDTPVALAWSVGLVALGHGLGGTVTLLVAHVEATVGWISAGVLATAAAGLAFALLRRRKRGGNDSAASP